MSKGADFQIRLQYQPGTVVVWVCNLFFFLSESPRDLSFFYRTIASQLTLLPLISAMLNSVDMLSVLLPKLNFPLKDESEFVEISRLVN